MISGGQPATAKPRKMASGFKPSLAAFSADIITEAAAPSLVCEELPAVTVPFTWNAGRSLDSPATVVSGRTPSSVSKTNSFSTTLLSGPTKRSTTVSGTISSLNLPSLIAAVAFAWLSKPNWSCCSRVTLNLWATFSAVRPIGV